MPTPDSSSPAAGGVAPTKLFSTNLSAPAAVAKPLTQSESVAGNGVEAKKVEPSAKPADIAAPEAPKAVSEFPSVGTFEKWFIQWSSYTRMITGLLS